MDETQSRSVWSFVDEGSGPIKQAANSVGALSAKMNKAEAASSAMAKRLGVDASATSATLEKEQRKQERAAQQQARLEQKKESDRRKLGLIQLEAGEMNKSFDEKRAAAPPKSETDMFQDELKARRMRLKQLKFEEARGNVYGSALQQVTGQTQKFGLSTNEMAEKAGGAVTAMEGIGFQMTSMGGKMGSIGTKLVGLAGPIGLGIAGLGLVYEGSKLLYEAIHDKTKKLEEEAKYQNFKSAADKASYEATKKRSAAEERMAYQVGQRVEAVGPRPDVNTRSDERDRFDKAHKQAAQELMKYGFTMEEATAGLDKGLAGSSASVAAHASKEFELAEIERKLISEISVLPYKPTAEQMQAHIAEVKNSVAELMKHNFRLRQDAGAITSNILARTEETGTLLSMVEKHAATEKAEAQMALNIKYASAMLPKKFDKMGNVTDAFSTAFANLIPQLAKQWDLDPEMVKKLMGGVDLAKSKPPVFNFSNSRFDIKQAFAEGFDPDRIAVAFTNDLAMLGERRLQSGLAPVYAAR